MATMGPRVPLIAPALYESGSRASAAAGAAPMTRGATGPAAGISAARAPTSATVPGQALGPQRRRPPKVPMPTEAGAAPEPKGPTSPLPPQAADVGPQGRMSENFTPRLKRNAGGGLSEVMSSAGTYAPPPDSSLPVLNLPPSNTDGPAAADRDDQGIAPAGSPAGYNDAPATQAPASGTQPAQGQPTATDRYAPRSIAEMQEEYRKAHPNDPAGLWRYHGQYQTDDGMPVYQWSDGRYYMEFGDGNIIPVDGNPEDGFTRGDGDWAGSQDGSGAEEDRRDIRQDSAAAAEQRLADDELAAKFTQYSDQALEQMRLMGESQLLAVGLSGGEVAKEIERRSRAAATANQNDPRQNQVGTTTSSLSSGQGASTSSNALTAGGASGGTGQPTGPEPRVAGIAKRTGRDPSVIAALLAKGIKPTDISTEGFRYYDKDKNPIDVDWDESDNEFLSQANIAAGELKSKWGATPGQSVGDLEGKQSSIEADMKALDGEVPEMNTAALEESISANRRRSAWEQSRALSGSLGRAAALGMSPEASVGIGGQIAGDFDTRNDASETSQRAEAMKMNFAAQMQHYQNKNQKLMMLLGHNLSAQDRAVVMAAAQNNAQMMAALGKDAQRFAKDLNDPEWYDYLMQGVGIAGNVASGGLAGMAG